MCARGVREDTMVESEGDWHRRKQRQMETMVTIRQALQR